MTLKIAVTVCDFGAAVHVGADPVRLTDIIEIPDSQIPGILKTYFENLRVAAQHKEKYGRDGHVYQTVSLSLVQQEEGTNL